MARIKQIGPTVPCDPDDMTVTEIFDFGGLIVSGSGVQL